MFRNQIVTCTKIMSKSEFKVIKFRFTCPEDPLTGKPIDMEFSARDFVEVDKDFGLFENAVREMIAKLPIADRAQAAEKY